VRLMTYLQQKHAALLCYTVMLSRVHLPLLQVAWLADF
jgi:hypothetical protein